MELNASSISDEIGVEKSVVGVVRIPCHIPLPATRLLALRRRAVRVQRQALNTTQRQVLATQRQALPPARRLQRALGVALLLCAQLAREPARELARVEVVPPHPPLARAGWPAISLNRALIGP